MSTLLHQLVHARLRGTQLNAPRTVPPPSDPLAVARQLAREQYTIPAGLVLRTHRGDFYAWDGTCYRELDASDVKATLYQWLEHATYQHPTKGVLRFEPDRYKIMNVIDALRAIVLVESAAEAPLWTGGISLYPATKIVAMENGLLHMPTRTLLPHTPDFFSHHALPFAFAPAAAPPTRWLDFLGELWPDDASSIATLQEVFGYLLGGDTRQQKIFLLVGPRRAGKGTLGRVLTGLLGAHQVAAPTLASLSTNFGLQPLIAKPLALISDARLADTADSKIVVERLLSISGEDSLTIDRKYRDPWTGRLPTRFVVLSNELPRLSDASGALASRFILFVLTRSFYGVENPGLTDELLQEAPAILNWALDGLDRLTERGYFVNPTSGAEAIQQLEDLASPIGAFLRQCANLPSATDPDPHIEVEALWQAWRSWCESQNQRPGTKAVFGRDLRANVPGIKRQHRRTPDGQQRWVYTGLHCVATSSAGSASDKATEDEPAATSATSSKTTYPSREDDPATGATGSRPLHPSPELFVFDYDPFGKQEDES